MCGCVRYGRTHACVWYFEAALAISALRAAVAPALCPDVSFMSSPAYVFMCVDRMRTPRVVIYAPRPTARIHLRVFKISVGFVRHASTCMSGRRMGNVTIANPITPLMRQSDLYVDMLLSPVPVCV